MARRAAAPALRTGSWRRLICASPAEVQLRKAAERTIHGLSNATTLILDLYSPEERANFFANCG